MLFSLLVRSVGFLFGFRWHTACLRDDWHGDGDSFWIVDTKGRQIHIRVLGMDSPEFKQPLGVEAGEARRQLCKGQQLKVRTHGRDCYERSLAVVTLGDGTDLALTMIQMGMAYSTGRSRLAQWIAKRKGLGVWSLSRGQRQRPWKYRGKAA